MKKIAALCMIGLLVLSGVGVYATGGSALDPLVTLEYVNETYIYELNEAVEDYVATVTQDTYTSVLSQLTSTYETQLNDLTQTGTWQEFRVKEGDSILLESGSSVFLLAGEATFTTSNTGAIINVTAGQTVAPGSSLVSMARYIVGEDTTAAIMITSETAVINLSGVTTTISSHQTDYNALADALFDAGMFKGSTVSYGSGYELERAPTRTEGIIMFLRMLGEEDAALSYTGSCPFVDAPTWCQSYLAYAYDKGYTNGIGTNDAGELIFGVNNTLSAQDYITFLLRTLGYVDQADSPDFTWSTALEFACTSNVLTQGEYTLFTTEEFLRAHVVYLSCFALTTSMKDGQQTLLSHLNSNGTVSETLVTSIFNSVDVSRID